MTKDQIKDANLEGDILKGLKHPNIIHFREVQTDNNYLYIIMDYADGGDLSMKIKEQNGKLFPEDKILDWFTQVCLAIKHIHDRKILHRDIKSQNIFLMKTGQVKLGDFGIAKCLDQTIDKAKTYVGTPYYLSPEIINSQPYGFQSDIWSLGVLLYEMCALKMPFDASNLPQLYIKIINCNYQPLNDIYSNELKKLVKDMLNEQYIKRPTISEILNNPIIRPRIKKFLNESEYNIEFSHTILHNFKLNSSHNDEKMTKNELISNNINNNNNNINNYRNNIRASQGHQRPIIKKEINERNLRVSANDSKRYNYNYQKQQMKQNKINILKRDLEPKPNNLIHKSNRQGFGKYNGNILYNYNNNGNNNNIGGGFFLLNEGKDYKMNESKRNKKNKNMGREEFSSDKINNKNNQNKINNININDNIYNGLRSENSAKFNSNKKRMEYEKKNNNIMNNLANNNNNSYRDKDKERKKNLEEVKKKLRRENKNKLSNQDGVIWMRGMENYSEKKEDIANNLNNGDNINSRMTDNNTEEPTIDRTQYDDLINLNKNEISGKNLLPLNNINDKNNMNTYSEDSQDDLNEEDVNNNNKLYEDFFKGEVLTYNNNKNINNFNGMKYSNSNNDNQDIISKLNENEIYEKNMEIDGDKVTEDVWNDISNDFGKELTLNISNIIKKYVYDDMLSYDYNKITENIIKDLKYKNISAALIEKAINKIPDIYYLILCNKL